MALGEWAQEPSEQPVKADHIFDGWYEDLALGDNPLTEEEVVEIQNDPALSLFYWVLEDGNGGYILRVEHDFDSDAIFGNTALHAR